ncbi:MULTISPECIES: indole-3-glycerol phosphate synthase TrpC [Dehalobacter]|jgi:indole-3-glycerol phosphate synthase|uniref:Indole-3-glycerol phosphate synthase n=1 Tax=Dehalobacter restrictus TaxID=55583 RepID=A0A857DIX1_9FIRM|nr:MULTISPECIES: indole-3-glycerol phosphate synthase TrpC [Dehalobacter]MCG1026149.1 indole-3-glycerol phosphate synthase TrpC [Dehalobacter sp.]OCZ53481.1 indole-3-glycerol phosphate synthase [Dehalobacter sp. TeCB1]QHA00442.1 indole-3-glycerol phosphate synthase TrpC [Dehalobacter restrictus]
MILDKIVGAKLKRLSDQKKKISGEELIEKLTKKLKINDDRDNLKQDVNVERPAGVFASALTAGRRNKDKAGISIIAEVKKASPSKGILAPDFDYLQIASMYEQLGAAAISVLTEQDYFLGSPDYLREIRESVKIPLLRKDFMIDPYQIYEAKILGADAILLIVKILDDKQLKGFLGIAEQIGLDCLVEVHDEAEAARAMAAGAGIIGINNRNLETFEVDLDHSRRIGAMIPDHLIKVSESGIHTGEDILTVQAWGFDAVLVGEAFMKVDSLERKFAELLQVPSRP